MTTGLQNHALTRRIGIPREEAVDAATYRSGRSTEGIYFIRHNDFVKIGWSSNLPQRQRDHFYDAGRWGSSAKVVAAVYGPRSVESVVHKYFSDSKHENGSREDFGHSEELCDYIRWLRDQYFVSVGEEFADGIVRDVEIVDPRGWLPAPERRKPHAPDLFVSETDYSERVVTGDDYYTPEWIIARAKAAMGEIDLDPASHAVANKTVGANAFYTLTDNGLVRPWYGRVWLNPPFSSWREFSERALTEWTNGRLDMMMCLVSATLLTANYFHPLLDEASSIIIPRGRMQFLGPMAGASPTGHMLLVFCQNIQQHEAVRCAFRDGFVCFERPSVGHGACT